MSIAHTKKVEATALERNHFLTSEETGSRRSLIVVSPGRQQFEILNRLSKSYPIAPD
jgi:hypothetical protein